MPKLWKWSVRIAQSKLQVKHNSPKNETRHSSTPITKLHVEILKKELFRKSKYEEYLEWSTIPVKNRTSPQMKVTQLMKNKKYLDICLRSPILSSRFCVTSRDLTITATLLNKGEKHFRSNRLFSSTFLRWDSRSFFLPTWSFEIAKDVVRV